MIKVWTKIFPFCLCILLSSSLLAYVSYDRGRLEINGIQLLQDSKNENQYYYIPPYPRVSVSKEGNFEFLCLKYVGEDESSSGGLFHTLVQFNLTQEDFEITESLLKEKFPDAMLMGPVAMQEYSEDGAPSSFRIVSSVLNSGSSGTFTSEIITSGRAPFFPGSKSAISALLNPKAATLLWETFEGHTSDVSIVVEGYFPAIVQGFKATINADLEIAYEHFSQFQNVQSGFSRDQLRESLDSLTQTGAIKVDVVDMSDGLGINTEVYQNILNIITDKVTNMLFNTKEGWGKMPETTAAIEPNEIKERYKRGAFTRFFLGDGTQMYVPDNQFLLKEKKEVRSFKFFLELNQSTSIKVPVYSAGNIGGFYEEFNEDLNYFKVVDLDDPAFQSRDLHFQISGKFLNCFDEVIENASVLVQKEYQNQEHDSYSGSVFFSKSNVEEGNIIQKLNYKRLGESSAGWLNYKYKVAWKLSPVDTIVETEWTESDVSSISISPPFEKRELTIDLDRSDLKEKDIASVRILFASVVSGKPYTAKMLVLRKDDESSSDQLTIYHDKDQHIVYQVAWYTKSGKIEDDLKILDDDYLYLIPPITN